MAIDKYAGSLWDESEDKWLFEKGEYAVLLGIGDGGLVEGGTFVIEENSHWLGL